MYLMLLLFLLLLLLLLLLFLLLQLLCQGLQLSSLLAPPAGFFLCGLALLALCLKLFTLVLCQELPIPARNGLSGRMSRGRRLPVMSTDGASTCSGHSHCC